MKHRYKKEKEGRTLSQSILDKLQNIEESVFCHAVFCVHHVAF